MMNTSGKQDHQSNSSYEEDRVRSKKLEAINSDKGLAASKKKALHCLEGMINQATAYLKTLGQATSYNSVEVKHEDEHDVSGPLVARLMRQLPFRQRC
jgi:hypothetical protein